MSQAKATALVVAAGALWGCISIFTRALGGFGITAMQITCIRMAVGTLGMFLVLLYASAKRRRAPSTTEQRSLFAVRPRDLWVFVGTGVVSLTLFNYLYFSTMQLSEVSIAVVLLYTSPVFVMLMSAMFFKEGVSAQKLVALGLTMAGSVLVAGLLGGTVQLTPQILAMGVGSGFFYATYTIFGRVALKRYDPLTVTFYTFLTGLVATLFLCDAPSLGGALLANPVSLAWGLGIGVACTILPYLLYTMGLQHMESSRAAILAMVEPLVGALVGFILWGESLTLQKLAGMALIFAAVTLLNLGTGKKTEPTSVKG